MCTFWIIYLTLFGAKVYAGCADDAILEMNDLSLRLSQSIWNVGDSLTPSISDRLLDRGWYSAVENGIQYIMTDNTKTLSYGHCNTYWPIFLKDLHPLVESLTENPVDAVACAFDNIYPCSTTYNIKIRKCDGKIQYYLQETSIFSGYCFENHTTIQGDSAPLPAPENVDLGEVKVDTRLLFELVKQNGYPEYIPYIAFECIFTQVKNTNYFYTVHWYLGYSTGSYHRLSAKGPTQYVEELILHEKELIANNFTLGIQMKCGVSVSRSETGLKTVSKFSQDFYAGMTISNTTVFLEKNSKASIEIKTTVPIGCRHQPFLTFVCREEIQMINLKSYSCKPGVATEFDKTPDNQRCVTPIQSIPNQGTWNKTATYPFSIVTIDETYDDETDFILKLQLGNTIKHEIWRDYLLPDVKVHVRNTEAYKKKICYCHIDPHMKTVDEPRGYEMQHHFGTYRMYHNTHYHIEVQIITIPCYSGYPKCACAVAVRAGKDVFIINTCGSTNYFGFSHCGDGGILQVVKVDDSRYNIYTPIGTLITVKRYGKFLNVDIVMAPKDLKRVEGLCGYFDDNPTNDFKRSDGITTGYEYHPDAFTKSWQFGSGLDNRGNLFQANPDITAWDEQNNLYCVCKKTGALTAEGQCSPSQYLNCEIPNSVTKNECRVTSNRRKRSLQSNTDKELERLFKLMQPVYPKRILKRQARSKFSVEEGTALCANKINGSLAVREYNEVSANTDSEEIIKQCVYDVTVGEDQTLADTHVEAVNTIVKNMIEKEPIYAANNTEKVVVFYENTCPGNCSGKGNCTKKSECICQQYLHGSDCSIDERDPLIIDDIEGGGDCDVAFDGDCMCFIVRSDNILEKFSCRVHSYTVSMDGTETYKSTNSSKGDYVNIFTGKCCIPRNLLGSQDVFVAKYKFAISNNDINYGNNVTMYVYDSSCQSMIEEDEGSRQFQLRENHCFIDGYCRSEEDMAPAGCLACKPKLSQVSWKEHNPCQNGGNCSGDNPGYLCSCVAGYGGMNCETDINECASLPCQNGGTCIDYLNGFNCSCSDGYEGLLCEIDIDECFSNPCQNGATCDDTVNGYNCTCLEGFVGIHCEIDVDDCLSNPCKHSHVCVDLVNAYQCQCREGFEGRDCDIDIDECETSRPCQHGGSCDNTYGGYTCRCTEGYEGANCQIDIDECASTPCRNSGTCTDQVNGYTCSCVGGYEGNICEIDIDECASSPCLNNGMCTDRVNGYICTCQDGYEGLNCETDTDECTSVPCLNNGSCTDQVNGYSCLCQDGYKGFNCEIDIDECASTPCQNNGTCTDHVNSYICACQDGYRGLACEIDTDECVSAPCQNHGTCTDLVNAYACICQAGYEGENCEVDTDECASTPCLYNGSCTDQVNGYSCLCQDGYKGVNCEIDIDECASAPCQNNGTCTDHVNGYICMCQEGYGGLKCEIDTDECVSAPCQNNGSCTDMVNAYACICQAGYEGENCEVDTDECASTPCLNNGSCTDQVNAYSCFCQDGYKGEYCEVEIDECASTTCQNNGTCNDLVNAYICTCQEGYGGLNCEIDTDECFSAPCQNHGSCTDLVNAFACICQAGYEGENCEVDTDECASTPCRNNGTCKDHVNGYICTCQDGYEGLNCEIDTDECISSPCQNHGSCTDLVNAYACICQAGYEGENCAVDTDECASFPCQNHGTCTDWVNGYTCICPDGYYGDNCETDLDECASAPCKNNGSCTDQIDGYICKCVSGYEGHDCEIDIDECSSAPCQNAGSCTDQINGYHCSCEDGYEGIRCEIDIDECEDAPCQNNGSCTDKVNGYVCTCLDGYEGDKCEFDIDECAPAPCQNNGTCTNLLDRYTCSCLDGFQGDNCEVDIDECSSAPCQNNGTCMDLLNGYSCLCPDGYEEDNCQIDTDDCASAPCKNGGTCTDLVDRFLCSCPIGYDGNNYELVVVSKEKKEKKSPSSSKTKTSKRLKMLEYLTGKLELQTEKKKYVAAKTEMVKQKTLYYRAMAAALAGNQTALLLNRPDK